MANPLDPSPSEDVAPIQPHSAERAPLSASHPSPLALARELASLLKQYQNERGEPWRLACALSLNIVDLLDPRGPGAETGEEAGANDKATTTGSDQLTR